jgi:hypothetical protein
LQQLQKITLMGMISAFRMGREKTESKREIEKERTKKMRQGETRERQRRKRETMKVRKIGNGECG